MQLTEGHPTSQASARATAQSGIMSDIRHTLAGQETSFVQTKHSECESNPKHGGLCLKWITATSLVVFSLNTEGQ